MKGGAYRYYGAAKNLPGVRELLKGAADSEHRATQSIEQIQRNVDVSYYGYLDDDDGILEPLEEKATKRALGRRLEEWEEESKRLKTERAGLGAGAAAVLAAETGQHRLSSVDEGFVSHVTLPSKEEIEKLIVARRKQELLKQYASSNLQEELNKTAKLAATSK
jgi:pre-mRNA-splicing factor ISY1